MNILNVQSMLGDNCRMPLLHMSKSYIWLEEKNQRINEFSIGYMMNPTLYRNRHFKDQVKVCFKHTFGPDITYHINKILQKKNTRVLALVIFYESRKTIITSYIIHVVWRMCVAFHLSDLYQVCAYMADERPTFGWLVCRNWYENLIWLSPSSLALFWCIFL